MESKESLSWKTKTTLLKFDEDVDSFAGSLDEFLAEFSPTEELVVEGNLGLNAGINLLWNLVCGAGGNAFNNANAHLAVGDGNAAAAAGQVDLQGATKTRRPMEATYPQSGANQKAVFRSSFGGGDGNHAWLEWGVANAAAAGTLLNRKVENLGTKAGGTWVLTVELTAA